MTEPKKRKPGTKFKPGKSGNPKGRKPGIPDRRSALRATLAGELPEIVKRIVEAAKNGDLAAASLILSRCLPPLRAQSEPVEIPALENASSLSDKAAAIIAAVANGQITTDQAHDLLSALGAVARIAEVQDLSDRIAALEDSRNDK